MMRISCLQCLFVFFSRHGEPVRATCRGTKQSRGELENVRIRAKYFNHSPVVGHA